MNGLARKTLVALFASALFVGCGAKSGKSTGRVAGPASQPTESSQTPQTFTSTENEQLESNAQGGEVVHIPQTTPIQQNQNHQEPGEVISFKPQPVYDGSDYNPAEDYGKSYDIIEKDRIYGDNTQMVGSGERFGEFGTVMFDDPMWYPGLPDYPAGHPQSKVSKIFTGALSDNGYKFTDGKSDGLMAYLVRLSDRIGSEGADYHEDVAKESRELANRIKDVKLTVDAYSTASIKLEIQFVDGNASAPVNTLFHGKLDAHRRSELSQVDIKGDKDLKFSAQITCMDQDGGCQNSLIQLVQWKDGKICRMAYIVHRSGDAHITMSESDRLHYSASPNINHQRLAEYLSNTTYNACQINKKRKDIPNRLTQHFLAYCGDGSYTKLPAAKTIGYETWAAAYGASGFRLTFADMAHWTGYDPQRKTTIGGALVHADVKNPIFSQKLAVQGALGAYIKSAHLVNNDGGGNINLLLRLNGVDESEMRLSVTSLIRNTIYPGDLRPEEKLPEDPRG